MIKYEIIDNIGSFFDEELLNIIYKDIKLNEGKDIVFSKNKRDKFDEVHIFKLNEYLVGSVGYTAYELKEKNIAFKELKLLSNDYNSPEPSNTIVYLKLLYDSDKNILGMQIANTKNIETRLEKVATLMKETNSLELLTKEKIYANTNDVNPDILNIAAFTALGKEMIEVKNIDSTEMERLYNNKEFILDVREIEEFEVGHIKGAINIPLRMLFLKQNELPKDKDIYVYCRTAHRSADAVNFLISMGFDKVYNVDGGFIDISFNEFRKNKGELENSIVTGYIFE